MVQGASRTPLPPSRSPVALIVAPTRELAMQITTVIKEVCAPFRPHRKVEVVSVVGGMSEQKQRRLLVGAGRGGGAGGPRKPVHVLVATPGRLTELIQVGLRAQTRRTR